MRTKRRDPNKTEVEILLDAINEILADTGFSYKHFEDNFDGDIGPTTYTLARFEEVEGMPGHASEQVKAGLTKGVLETVLYGIKEGLETHRLLLEKLNSATKEDHGDDLLKGKKTRTKKPLFP